MLSFGFRRKLTRRFISIGLEYERKTPIEHVLLRPEMYIGQIAQTKLETWKVNQENEMEKSVSVYSPGLLKIFDEILVNAADNRHRDVNMSRIDVVIEHDKATNKLLVTVENDGRGIPVEMHPTEKMYIPELVFGHLLTGSNFKDENVRW